MSRQFYSLTKKSACDLKVQPLSNRMKLLASFLAGVSILIWIMHSSYFGGDHVALLVWPGNDGHCDPPSQGFGAHCWGDYFVLRFDSILSSPSPAEALYPLGARLLRLPFWLVGKLAGYRMEVCLYLVAVTASCLSPLWMATKSIKKDDRAFMILVFGFGGLGYLTVFDRGNQLGLIVLPLYLFLRELLARTPRIGILSALFVVVVIVKPQFVILLLLLIPLRQVKAVLLPAFSGLLYFLISQVVLGKGVSAIGNMWTAMGEWVELGSPIEYPTNLSAYRLLELVQLQFQAAGYLLPTFIILLIVVTRLIGRQPMNSMDLATSMMMMVLFGSISYVYYSVLAVVAVAISCHVGYQGTPQRSVIQRFSVQVVMFSIVIMNAPLAIRNSWIGLEDFEPLNVWAVFASFTVLFACIFYGVTCLYTTVDNANRDR